MGNEFARRLASMQSAWGSRKEQPKKVPAGRYLMKLQAAVVAEAKSSGRLMIKREHLILEGQCQGEVVYDYMQLETERGPYFVSKWIDQMGFVSPDKPEDLPKVVEEIVKAGPVYQATLKENGEFRNITIDKLIEHTASEESAEPAEEVAEETTDAVENEAPFDTEQTLAVGTEISFQDNEGNTITGAISSLDGENVVVTVDDTEYSVPATEVTVAESGDTATNSTEKEEADDTIPLVELAQAHGVTVDDSLSLDDLVAELQGYTWKKDELTKEELALLQKHNIKTVAAPVKKTAAPAAPKTPTVKNVTKVPVKSPAAKKKK